jgi:regulator of nucleoside diphosphate kinase
MHAISLGERKLTELDAVRLRRFTAAGVLPHLSDLLDEADTIAPRAIPADVITMYARFTIRDLQTQERQSLALCYPRDADAARGQVSVLSPAGMGLIGHSVGSIARWTAPGGEERAVRVESIEFQPEATGDYIT